MNFLPITALTLGFLATGLSGCAGLSGLTAPGGTANAKQVIDNLNAFNEAVAKGPCAGWGNLDWNPPLPPTGGLHALCQFGNPNIGKGAPGVTGPLSDAIANAPLGSLTPGLATTALPHAPN